MEILKRLLAEKFEKRIEKLESRTTQELKDLQFTGEAFIKQGKLLHTLASIDIDEIIRARNKSRDHIKRDNSADKHMKPIRNRTPVHEKAQDRSRSKTPTLGTSNTSSKTGILSKKGRDITPTHLNTKTSNFKGNVTPGRDRTPERRDKKSQPNIMNIRKKEHSKDLKTSKDVKKINLTPVEGKVIKKIEHRKPTEETPNITQQSKHEESMENGLKTEPHSEMKSIQLFNDSLPAVIKKEAIQIEEPLPQSLPAKIEEIKPSIKEEKEKYDIEQFIKENPNNSVIKGITDYLRFNEKIQLYSTMKCFKKAIGLLIKEQKKQLYELFNITPSSSIEVKINELRFKYKAEQLNCDIVPFQITRGALKAVELLNEGLYNRIFHQTELPPPLNEIVFVYRTFFQLLNIKELCSIEDDIDFWLKASTYILDNSNAQTGTYISKSAEKFDFSNENVIKIMHIVHEKTDNIKPTYFSKICGTTGLVIFLIKDALEYCGVMFAEKKTNPVLLYNRLCYLNTLNERVEDYIDYLNQE